VKILLTRLDRLGDLILSTPAIRSFRRSFPEAEITLACSRRNAVAVADNPDLDRVLIVDADRAISVGRGLRGIDLAVALAPCTADILCVAATRAKRRLGYTYVRRWGTRLLAHCVLTEHLVASADPVLVERDPELPVPHEVDQILALVRLAGGEEIVPEIVLPISAADHQAVAGYPEQAILLHLAPRWRLSGYTETNLIALLHDLRRYRRPLIVTAGDDVADLVEIVRRATDGLVDAVADRLPFGQWAALFARAACIVTVDTSATHVASAVGRPAVVLFEHAAFALNAREWAPYRVAAVVVRKPAQSTDASFSAMRQELVAGVGRVLSP